MGLLQATGSAGAAGQFDKAANDLGVVAQARTLEPVADSLISKDELARGLEIRRAVLVSDELFGLSSPVGARLVGSLLRFAYQLRKLTRVGRINTEVDQNLPSFRVIAFAKAAVGHLVGEHRPGIEEAPGQIALPKLLDGTGSVGALGSPALGSRRRIEPIG